MYNSNQVVFLDVETTGLRPTECDIWEIAIIRGDQEFVWQNRVRPNAQVDDWVKNSENSRFTTEYDKFEAYHPTKTAERLLDLLGPNPGDKYGRHVIGACPWFDSQRLHQLLMRYHPDYVFDGRSDHPWHYHLIDVECLILGYLKGMHDQATDEPFNLELPMKSDDLSRMIGVEPPDKTQRHTALGDARWAKAIFDKIYG